MTYYADKIQTLLQLFGRNDVILTETALTVGATTYPILDDVIILLPIDRCPDSIRARLAKSTPRDSGNAVPTSDLDLVAPSDFAGEIQRGFGAEWETFREIRAEHREEFALYFDQIDLHKLRNQRVCDLGCGIGRWSYFLAPHAKEVVLVDFSTAIFVARENLRSFPNTLFFLGDVTDLPFRPDFADFAFSLGVLHHLPIPSLHAVRRLRDAAPTLLIYLYYALDNRPRPFRWMLALVTAVRKVLSQIHNPSLRHMLTVMIAAGVYLPMISLGHVAAVFGFGHKIPLYEFYRNRKFRRICQDVYDRFFTAIEQRVSRAEIATLADTFSQVQVSDGLPYWHFVCRR